MFVNKTHEKAHETLKAGEVEKAIELYTEALKEAPKHCDILGDRGVAYMHLKDKERCMNDLNETIALQPQKAYRYACRAFARNSFGDIDGAVKDYEKAVELDPDDAVAHNNLGLLLEQKGYKNEANERFERADKLSKQEDNLLNAMDEMENGEIEIEEEIVEKPEKTTPESTDAEEEQTTASKEFKKVFTSKSQFKEFLRFIKNGFKIK